MLQTAVLTSVFSRIISIVLLAVPSIKVTLSLALLFLYSHAIFAEKSAHRVRDLAYGTALYEYYQQDYFNALSELLVAEKNASILHHAEFSKLLRGGIYLSYGMDTEAEQLFYQVIEGKSAIHQGYDKKTKKQKVLGKSKKASRENIARAWFYLGKLLYKKGYYADASEKFSKVNKYLTTSLYPEYVFLSESAQQRTDESIPVENTGENSSPEFTPRVAQSSSWSFYKEYNQLMVALNQLDVTSEDAQTDRMGIANSLMQLAARISGSTAVKDILELLSLQDQIYTSAGFLFLQSNQTRKAISSFKRVRKESVLVGQALLGYGWAAINHDDFESALVPWQELTRRSMLESSTHEGLLAVPFVYEKLGATAAALAAYDNTDKALKAEIDLLAAIANSLKDIQPEQLADYMRSNAVTWLDEDAKSLSADPGQKKLSAALLQDRLTHLLAQNHFSLLQKQRQDVQWLLRSLQNWQVDLETVSFVVEARKQRAAIAVNSDSRDLIHQKIKNLINQRDTLVIKQKQAKNTDKKSLELLLNTKELKTFDRLKKSKSVIRRIENNLKLLSEDGQDASKNPINVKKFLSNKQKILWAESQLLWNVSEDSTWRNWRIEKAMREINQTLSLLIDKESELQKLSESSALQLEEIAKTDEIHNRIEVQYSNAKALANKIDRNIVVLLKNDVERLRKQTTLYLAQARLARARLLDTLNDFGGNTSSDTHDEPDTLPAEPMAVNNSLSESFLGFASVDSLRLSQ